MDDQSAPAIRKLRPPIAVLISLVTWGLGQVYNGQLAKGVVVLVTSVCVSACAGLLLLATFSGLLIGVLVAILLTAVVAADAGATARRVSCRPKTRFDRWYIYLAFLVVGGVSHGLVRSAYRFHAYRQVAESMEPTISPSSLVMAQVDPYRRQHPRRGDIVAFRAPHDASLVLLKRVVAISGDVVEVRDKVLLVNGTPLSESYVTYRDASFHPERDRCRPLRVPADHVYVLGDNRDYSLDSRAFGCIPASSVLGRALYCYYSRSGAHTGKSLVVHRV